MHASEILGLVGFDFVVIDQEHAPLDRQATDQILLGTRAGGLAGLVRVAESTPAKLLAALDDGAAGVLVPHVSSARKAEDVAAACRYRGGSRGFFNSPRAGGYSSLSIWKHVDVNDEAVTVIAMIDDPEALDELDAIMAVPSIDSVFIGRGDLTVALGAAGMDADEIIAIAQKITQAARRAGKPVCMMAGSAADAQRFQALGVSAFVVSSDQGMMRQAASKLVSDFAALPKPAASGR
ncbi:MAG: aldolase/citrate lyase family protein [Rhizobiaceae bacterium]|nr:aldolase/citrate lyase family protein [Rhizobiaceae bacterium]